MGFALEIEKQLSAKFLLMQFTKVNEQEILKMLNKMNILQIEKVIKGVFKDKYYSCISYISYRRSNEDQQWIQIENKARDQI